MDKAIEQFKKSLELQPNNYFLLANLGGYLIEQNRKEEALKLYTQYFKVNGEDAMEDKVTYIDCLLNMSISQTDPKQEQKGLEKAREMLEKHFPTFDDVEKNLSQEAIQGLYLKLAEYAEAEAGESKNFL